MNNRPDILQSQYLKQTRENNKHSDICLELILEV